nr:MAG TPA: hypothetical protein [Caudoviricetes sp.]
MRRFTLRWGSAIWIRRGLEVLKNAEIFCYQKANQKGDAVNGCCVRR